MSEKKPNIVLLMTDQHKASATGFMGNKVVQTPFFDSLARDGVVFDRAFAPSPICTPSRASMFTGVHPLVHDVTCHQNRVPYNLPQLSELLQNAGYYTAVAGHYEPNRNLARGWHEQTEFIERGILFDTFAAQKNAGRKDVGWSAGRLGNKLSDGNSTLLTDRMIRMLDQIETASEPFFLHAAYNDPHPPYFAPPPYDELIDPADVELPSYLPADSCPPWQAIVREQLRSADATEADVRKVLAVYYGMIAYADNEAKRLFDEMKKRNLLENTWVIFTSDHGDYAGEKGMFAKSETLYDCLLHVPMCFVPPAGYEFPRGERTDTLIDTVDIFPTILGLAGAETPGHAQGYDLCEWLSGDRKDLRDYVFSQVGNYHGFLGTTFPSGMPAAGRHKGLLQRARSKHYSYVRDPDYGDEAYDLRNDSGELHNILADGDGPAELNQVYEALNAWESECRGLHDRLGVVTGDRGFVEGWE
jgi:arylsulfatase A-like enzyme